MNNVDNADFYIRPETAEETAETLVEISGFGKVYEGADAKAVDGLSLKVNAGDIFGFIGRNGAGKSTTIKCLTGQLPYSEGKITV
ncbi:MAG: ATP-binding cassette domain-containing protein, partial [Clostridia bacterium]|nr:ATP-binding cassette domain-containing protein [Clostridia bacterium]